MKAADSRANQEPWYFSSSGVAWTFDQRPHLEALKAPIICTEVATPIKSPLSRWDFCVFLLT